MKWKTFMAEGSMNCSCRLKNVNTTWTLKSLGLRIDCMKTGLSIHTSKQLKLVYYYMRMNQLQMSSAWTAALATAHILWRVSLALKDNVFEHHCYICFVHFFLIQTISAINIYFEKKEKRREREKRMLMFILSKKENLILIFIQNLVALT